MGAMKAMKKKSVSKDAKGVMAKAMVLRKQGEDCWWLDCEGPHQEQVRQDCQQEEVCAWQEVPMDSGRREGTQGPEDHWLRCHQEGLPAVRQGKGVLQPVSATLSHLRMGRGKWRHQLQVWGFPQLR